jgi:septum formation protein
MFILASFAGKSKPRRLKRLGVGNFGLHERIELDRRCDSPIPLILFILSQSLLRPLPVGIDYDPGVASAPAIELILASTSPRRAKMLAEAGHVFVQMKPPFADPPQPTGVPGLAGAVSLALEMAERKALSLRDAGVFERHPGALLLAADTVCVGADGALIGQPADGADARRMIESFIGVEHDVVTGVALLGAGWARVEPLSDVARVWIGPVDADSLTAYLASGDWHGKAGGYNLEDRLRAGWPIRVKGDVTTVMGLPMLKINQRLQPRNPPGMPPKTHD